MPGAHVVSAAIGMTVKAGGHDIVAAGTLFQPGKQPSSGKMPRMSEALARRLRQLLDQINTIIVGKAGPIEDCVACLLAGGHLLIEDVPGVGKTTLAHALAVSIGLRFARVQFTADLLPSDLVGVSVWERSKEAFVFHPGPVFAQVLLADEINRAGPKTQSALLEAMEEQQVTVEGRTRGLPKPFFVIATQNPTDQLGTYPLPESQLDRFLMCITLGYPDRASERALLAGEDRRQAIDRLTALMTADELLAAQQAVRQVHASEALLDYLQALIAETRSGRWFAEGLSPRAGIAVLRAARARALLDQRDYVAPDDVQAILPQTIAHRLRPVAGAGRGSREQVRAMVEAVAVP
jgi:MoxR-like ATPase